MESNYNLYKDLISDFHTHDKSTSEQIALLEPLAVSMKSTSMQRMLQSWWLVLLEVVVWVLVAAAVLGVVLTERVVPFDFISKVSANAATLQALGAQHFDNFYLGVKALFAIIAFALFIIARMVASIRSKNKILSIAAKNMKLVAEQLLRERSHIESMYAKYPFDLPKNQDSIIIGANKNHDDVLL